MAKLIKADGTTVDITPAGDDGHLTYDQIREAIGGGYLEHVAVDPAVTGGFSSAWLDEEGKMKALPYNENATVMSTYTSPMDMLCGDVLFCTAEEDLT